MMKKTPGILSDEEIIKLYFKRDGDAIAETERKYGAYLYAIISNFVDNEEDRKECQNDAYLGIWNTVPPENPSSFKSYIGRIARNIAVSVYRKTAAEKRACNYACSLDELSEAIPDFDNEDASVVAEVMKKFLHAQADRDAAIFVYRFYYAYNLKDIAKATGLSVTGVHKVIERMKSELKKQLENEGINV